MQNIPHPHLFSQPKSSDHCSTSDLHTTSSQRPSSNSPSRSFSIRQPPSTTSVSQLLSNFRKRLSDLIIADVNSFKDMVVSFVSILKQVTERRIPKTYDYHQMSAPVIQVKLLKFIALLGSGDKQSSGHMYTVLGDIFMKCEKSSNIGNVVLYECICCISYIHQNKKLLDSAVEATSKFLKSDSHNLKYMVIDALGRLVKINQNIAEEHLLVVIDCLEDPDDTLKRKTSNYFIK